MSALAIALEGESRYAEAERLLREALDRAKRKYGSESWITLFAMDPLATALLREGYYAEAEKVEKEVLNIRRRVYGPGYPDTLESLDALAIILSYEGRYSEAERIFRDAIKTAGKNNQPSVLAGAWYDFACAAAAVGRHDEALRYLQHAIDHGWEEPDSVLTDPDLKSLHGDPRFDALVAKARQNATQPH